MLLVEMDERKLSLLVCESLPFLSGKKLNVTLKRREIRKSDSLLTVMLISSQPGTVLRKVNVMLVP